MKAIIIISVFLLFCLTLYTHGQQKLDLATALGKQQIEGRNRTLSIYDHSPGAVEMHAARGDGLAVLKDIIFDGGTIEVESRTEPVLKVERLVSDGPGKIGLWVGNGSSGRFRNLVLH